MDLSDQLLLWLPSDLSLHQLLLDLSGRLPLWLLLDLSLHRLPLVRLDLWLRWLR